MPYRRPCGRCWQPLPPFPSAWSPIWNGICQGGQDPFGSTLEIPVMLALLFINASLFLLFGQLARLMQEVRGKSLLEQQLRLQEDYYREMAKAQHRICRLHHDMKHHLTTVAALAGDPEKGAGIPRYLGEAFRDLQDYEQVVHTGNEALDSILNTKLA